MSLVANVVLWFKNETLRQAVLLADYNDRAWAALNTFQAISRTIDEEDSTKLQAILERIEYNSSNEEWLKRVDESQAQWQNTVPQQVKELKSKLDSYRDVTRHPLEASRYAEESIQNLRSPLDKTDQFLSARISELRHLEESLESLQGYGPTLEPPPGLMGLIARIDKLEAALEVLKQRKVVSSR